MDTKKIKEDIQLLWLWLAFLQKSFDLARTSRITENYLFLLMLLYGWNPSVDDDIAHSPHFPFSHFLNFHGIHKIFTKIFRCEVSLWLWLGLTLYMVQSNFEQEKFSILLRLSAFFIIEIWSEEKINEGKFPFLMQEITFLFSLFNPFFFPLSFHPHGFVHNQLSSDGSSLFCWCYFFPSLSFFPPGINI